MAAVCRFLPLAYDFIRLEMEMTSGVLMLIKDRSTVFFEQSAIFRMIGKLIIG
jgi:hypothetical protein